MSAVDMRQRGRISIGGRLAGALLILAATLTGLASPVSAQPIDPNWSPPRTVYVPETGQTLDRLFLDLWRNWGGHWSFGYPITPEYTLDNGHIVQYFEYTRFEYMPDGDEYGNLVRFGNLGEELRPLAVPRRFAPNAAAPLPKSAPAPDDADASATGAAGALASVLLAWAPLAAEEIGVDSFAYRYVPATGHSVQTGFKGFWEATGEASYLGNPLTEEYVQGGITYQVFEHGQLAWEPGVDPYMVPVGEVLAERYALQTAPVAQEDFPTYDEALFVPPILKPGAPPTGAVAGAAKSMVVSISQQAMWAFEGNAVVLTSYVSTGKERFDTPTGLFYVNSKIPVQDMAGVLGGEAYDVPAVPDVMYFTNRGHAIHGAYWHNNFGNVMSHGCINLPMDVADWLYEWSPVGLPVLIVA